MAKWEQVIQKEVPLTRPAGSGHPLPLGEGFARKRFAIPLRQTPDVDDAGRNGCGWRRCSYRCRSRWGSTCRSASTSTTTATTTASAAAKPTDGAFRKSDAIVSNNQTVPVSATTIQRRDHCSGDCIEHAHMTACRGRVIDVHQAAGNKRSVTTSRALPGFRKLVVGAEL